MAARDGRDCATEPDSVLRALASCKVEKQNRKKPFWRTLMGEADGGSDLSSRGTRVMHPEMRSLLLWSQEEAEEDHMSSQM